MTDSGETKIEQIVALARAQGRDDDPSEFPAFLRAYFGDAHPEHLTQREPAALLAICRRHRALAARRRPEQARVDVYKPDYPAPSGTYAVATVAADVPFLVDSVAIAVRGAGGAPDWLLHPVLRFARDASGALTGLAGSANSQPRGDEESLIHLQFTAGPGFDAQKLTRDLPQVLDDLRVVVGDFDPMRWRLRGAADELAQASCGVDSDESAEGQAFLRWLAADHFTFLGYRQRQVTDGSGGEEAMVAVPGTSLGLLREDRPDIDPHGYVAPATELDKYASSPRLVVVTKSNTRAWLHRAETMDVIAVKRLDDSGNVIGAHRFLGLFSSEAYAASPRDIPMLRRKLREVQARAALRPGSHTAKTLDYVLDTYPRDELFQSGEDELYRTAMGLVALRESQRLRLFLRRDRYGRFFSCLVYVPRERYNPALRQRLGARLAQLLGGEEGESWSQFLRGGLVRAHYIVATDPGAGEERDTDAIEAELLALTRTWREDFNDALAACAPADANLAAYGDAFPAGYTDRTPAAEAVGDARVVESLEDGEPVLRLTGEGDVLRLKLYGNGEESALADVLPLFENFGLRVTSQRPFAIRPVGRPAAWVHEFRAPHPGGAAPEAAARVEAVFAATWTGRAENDSLNRLVLAAGMDTRRVALLRAITRYLLQTPLPFGQASIEDHLAAHPEVAKALVALFYARCDPAGAARDARGAEIEQDIRAALDAIASLDADRVLRAFLAVVQATLRSNYFQTDGKGGPKPWISLKLDPRQLPELPEPRPVFETFVYAPAFEGVHLRAGKVSRGGLRWSDRHADYRTEVLGLMKAQVVKNAVIVPVGAKGGFVVKNAPEGEDRGARQKRGIDCYSSFIRGLLDITDNLDEAVVKPPPDTVCHDGDDPYLVVAADKGTAGFSDAANGIAREYGYWLDDAFASGGSAGYDHKTMGITARGGWEGVKRHFREIGRDIQRQGFTVVGIGDMGGDVFGNAMLLSPQIRLLAAFNHRHILIDPDPDPARSFAERGRLFAAGAGWDDYDRAVLSAGGGIYLRSEKSIELSEQARAALGIDPAKLAPNEIICALLKAPVDLLWNGGIGTYVKARTETDAEVGDRANDGLRINGRDLRCKVVGEGGNLGFTQAGRIEFARAGGRLNTDAIDNSGGVDSSDLEVNIKIALEPAVAAGRLDRGDRDWLLASMTEDVCALVLRTNYLQTQLISVLEGDAARRLDEHVNFIRALERDGRLDRGLEQLPDEEGLEERLRGGEGLTRPELAVLVSYAKIALFDDLLDSELVDDPYLDRLLLAGFPAGMRAEHADAIRGHRLRREMVATLATNQMVDRMGVALAHRLAAERGVARATVVRAFLLASEAFDAETLCGEIEALDNHVTPQLQYRLLKRVAGLIKHAVAWLAAQPGRPPALGVWLSRYRERARLLLAQLPEHLAGAYREDFEGVIAQLDEEGVPAALARRLAIFQNAGGVLDILTLGDTGQADAAVAAAYFEVGDWLGLPWLQRAIQDLEAEGRWQALARASLRDDCYRAHRRIVAELLASDADNHSRIRSWQTRRGGEVDFVRQRLAELQAGEAPGFAHLAVAVRDLDRLGSQNADEIGQAFFRPSQESTSE